MANKEKLLANAQKFLSKGQVSKAIGEYKKLVDTFPKDVRNRQKLAELLSREKRIEDALAEYEIVAKHYTETGFYLKSIAVFKQMQKIEPSRVDIYHRLAELNEKQGLIGNALTEYRTLVSHYEKNAMHQEAIEVLAKMVELDPDNLNFSAKIAECYMASGLNEPALEKFQELIEPLAAKGEHVKTIKLYERFLDICPEDGKSRLPLAQALLLSGSPDKATQVLKELLKHSPQDPEILRFLTDSYVAVEDFDNARLALKHLLKEKPEDLDIREYYVRVCIDAGDVERARDRLEEWKDSFFHAERITILRDFYLELKDLLADDPLVAEALSVIGEIEGEVPTPVEPQAPAPAATESVETDDRALIDNAIDDVEAFEMVGEEVIDETEVPSLDVDKPAAKLSAEKTAAVGVELDLDLNLNLESDISAVEEETPVAAKLDDEDVELEVEVELDFDDIGELDIDFEDDTESEQVAVASIAEDEIAGVDSASSDDGLADNDQFNPLELAKDFDLPAEDDTLDDLIVAAIAAADDEQEPLPEEDVSTELPEADACEEIEDLEAIEEFELLEEIEELEEIEAVEVLEEIEPSIDESPAAKDGFAAALNVDAELEEAEFYLQQGLFDDAERVVQTLMEYRPGLPELHAKIDQINQGRQSAATEPSGAVFVDLMADIKDDDLQAATDFLDSFSSAPESDDLSQKLVSELDSSDTESHFNLGIAYKEMGLLDDAIVEFEKASNGANRKLDCVTLIGQCHMQAGDTEAAMAAFKSGLDHEALNDESRMTLNFELGMLHQMNGQLPEALECFLLVAEKDSFFREVASLIKNLRRELDIDDDSDDDGGPQGNRDRVSYV